MPTLRQALIAVFLTLTTVNIGFAANSEEPRFGPNLLRSNPAVQVYQEAKTGVPTFVKGNLSQPALRGTELTTLLSFFEQNRGAFQLENPAEELALRRSEVDELGMTHLRLDQKFRGVRVVGGDIAAHFNAEGILRGVNGTLEPIAEFDVNPNLTIAAAEQIALADLSSEFNATEIGRQELVIFPWEGEYHLCWRMFLTNPELLGRWEYFVDAGNGDVVFKANALWMRSLSAPASA